MEKTRSRGLTEDWNFDRKVRNGAIRKSSLHLVESLRKRVAVVRRRIADAHSQFLQPHAVAREILVSALLFHS